MLISPIFIFHSHLFFLQMSQMSLDTVCSGLWCMSKTGLKDTSCTFATQCFHCAFNCKNMRSYACVSDPLASAPVDWKREDDKALRRPAGFGVELWPQRMLYIILLCHSFLLPVESHCFHVFLQRKHINLKWLILKLD